MQPVSSRDLGVRSSRLPCGICGESIELVRLRTHLRTAHQMTSTEVESVFLDARRTARRTARSQRR
jgi:hypothetical protein